MRGFKKTLLQSAAFATIACLPSAAFAQIEEIVVTAQKREQSIQDVPISIVAVSGEEMLDRQISGTEDLVDSLPNVFVSKDTISNNIYVRGVGSGSNGGFEQAVATFIDGVYHGRSRYTQASLVDIERVEILRGPQTIYFGNNAIGGALSVTTRQPDLNEWDGFVQASYEFEGNEPVIEAGVGGPVVPGTLAVRVAGRYSHLDGFIKNLTTGNNNPNVEDRFVRFSALWQIAPSWSTTFKAEYGKQDSISPFAPQITNCPPEPPFTIGFACGVALANGQEDVFDYRRASIDGERGEIEASEFLLKIERDNLNGIGVVLQGSLSKNDFLLTAGNGLATPFFAFSAPEKLNQKTLELRLVSPADSKLKYIFGGYYLSSDLNINTNLAFPFATALLGGPLAALLPFAPLSGTIFLDQKEEAFSLFGSVTYPITERLSGTVGLRYTNSKKTAVQSATNSTANDNFGLSSTPLPDALQPLAQLLTGFTQHTTVGRVKDDDFLPSISLQYEANDNATFYAKFSEGFKAGGFDAVELTGIPDRLIFAPETVKAYEAGIKTILMNNTLRFNLSIFRSDYQDLQQAVSQFTATSAFITLTNVGGLKSQGFEAELDWQPSDRLKFGVDFALLDAAYKNYPNAGCNALQAFQAQQAGLVGCSQDLSGQSPPFAPDYSGNISAGYTHPVGDTLEISIDTVLSFSGAYDVIVDKDPATRQRAWQKLDARFGLGGIDDRWNIAFVGKNLTNERVIGSATDVVASAGSYTQQITRGRTLALQARFSF